jgi:hypothetical protein
MTDEAQAAEPRENVAQSPDWVGGEGGPQFSQGGMMPGGAEMENWRKPPNDAAEAPDDSDSVKDQAERLVDRLGNG